MTLLAASVLIGPESADACVTAVEPRVRAVGHARAAGPFVFLILCGPNTTRCAEGPPDVRVRQGSVELGGTTKLKAEVPGRG